MGTRGSTERGIYCIGNNKGFAIATFPLSPRSPLYTDRVRAVFTRERLCSVEKLFLHASPLRCYYVCNCRVRRTCIQTAQRCGGAGGAELRCKYTYAPFGDLARKASLLPSSLTRARRISTSDLGCVYTCFRKSQTVNGALIYWRVTRLTHKGAERARAQLGRYDKSRSSEDNPPPSQMREAHL